MIRRYLQGRRALTLLGEIKREIAAAVAANPRLAGAPDDVLGALRRILDRCVGCQANALQGFTPCDRFAVRIVRTRDGIPVPCCDEHARFVPLMRRVTT